MRGPGHYLGSSWRVRRVVKRGVGGGVGGGGGGGGLGGVRRARGAPQSTWSGYGLAVGGIYTRSAVGQFNLCVKSRTLSKRGGPPESGALGSCPVCPVLSSALI